MEKVMDKIKLIIPVVLIVSMFIAFLSGTEDIVAEKSDGYFEFNDNISINLKNGKDPKTLYQKLEIIDKDGKEVPYISNIINKEKIVISPLRETKGKVNIKNLKSYTIDKYEGIVYVDNEWNLKKISEELYKDFDVVPLGQARDVKKIATDTKSAPMNDSIENQKEGNKSETNEDFSKTNLQEMNVDEADIVKTDGEYIYYISRDNLYVVKNVNGKLEKISEIGNMSYVRDMYLKGERLVLVGEDNTKKNNNYKVVTSVTVYDLKDKAKLKKIGSTYIDGRVSDTRFIGDNLYVITEDYFGQIYEKNDKDNEKTKTKIMPDNRKVSLDPKSTNLKKLIYFPLNSNASITRISSYNISNFTRKDSQYMGYKYLLYMSEKNAYVSYDTWKYSEENDEYDINTRILRFALNNGDIRYNGNCEVNGTLINQFSLSETNDTLFVAYNSRNKNGQDNNVASFDENLVNIGNIRNIAPDERIYSTRFFGNMLYMVTFKDIDPLFAIDISNPTNMKILGHIKMPGYSTYLHPYKDGKLIGFGQDTKTNKYGNTVNDGFKMALFDMSDPKNIKILDEVLLGDAGSHSPLEYDHKAIMTDTKNDIIGFPMVITKSKYQVDSKGNNYETHSVIFNGALVYKIEDNKFKLDGKISHVDKKQDPNNSYDEEVQRIIYIGDNYFTMTLDEIKSVSRKSYKDIDKVMLKQKKDREYIVME